MGAKVKGIREAKANLNRLINDIQGRKAVRAITKALIIGASQAALYTPIDTSTLINSQFRDISANGTRLTGRVGYSANYAIYVHDPNVKQVFRRPMAEKEFLTKGFADAKQSIEKAIMEEMKL
ncbi:HK97 gp10 family phage protein [Yersinia enterocolitica]|uniref:HK97 gp10 family phage protein n=1 Tax=Yersinia enterocolitica TaxID=630 RepID=UPI00287451E4|nr:HK97 gp10 family phage protein [Yersinia enterocolitica]EKN5956170.1 HK97 gp10 family phage protein [Yersinia enterocolitica]EKN6046154.1 HK97 gp10 family phage protein [Yersinia enterocolitica]EKN6388782.1 HK97 gp10 family phage protein [Yersinia enterocolitica]ELY5220927.1 HK97 gp10 family phage protein [Yersinia enterocolitica]